MFQALHRVDKQISDLITRSGRVQTRHFGAKLNERPDTNTLNAAYSIDQGSGGSLYTAPSCRSRIVSINSPSVFHVEIMYNYNYTRYQIEHARILSLLDAFGVNLNPAIIWNAIPWSFVVDWVFGVSRWLDQFKLQNMAPAINIHQALWSISRYRQTFSTFRLGQGTYAKCPMMPMPTVTEVAYRRQVFRPTASSIQSSGLNLKEFSLGSALVFARKWKPKQTMKLSSLFKEIFFK